MRTTKLTFGLGDGVREYQVAQLPTKQNTRWKQRFREPLQQILGLVDQLREKFGSDFELGSLDDLVFLKDVLLNSIVLDYVVEGLDIFLDMVIAFSPTLEADREWIEEHAYDEQVVAALVEELKLALPFQSLGAALTLPGPATTATSTNSPWPNGESGVTRSSQKLSQTSLLPTPVENAGKPN